MNIDPRQLKQMLQLQFQPSALIGSPQAGNAKEDSLDFAEMLNMLMQQEQSVPQAAEHGANPFITPQAGGFIPSNHTSFTIGNNDDYDLLITEASSRYQVDPSLIKALIQAESSFDKDAVSSAGAKGLMQLMDRTAAGLGVTNPFDPEQNIHGGTRFLAGLLDKYNGNQKVALAAYNAGPGRIDRLGIRTDADLQAKFSLLPRETQNYVNKVSLLQNYFTEASEN